jgi:hypothetical protein
LMDGASDFSWEVKYNGIMWNEHTWYHFNSLCNFIEW